MVSRAQLGGPLEDLTVHLLRSSHIYHPSKFQLDPKVGPLIGRFPEFEPSDQAEIWRGGRYGNSAVDERLDLPKDLRAGLWGPRPKLV